MNSPASEKVTREELYALVWEKPATDVAQDLGISDVALSKLCRRLQIPKPPRGYWARVKAGRAPRRPNLEAFSEKLHALRKAPPEGLIPLTPKQHEYFTRALEQLASAGTDTSQCTANHRGIQSVSPELAAKIIILVQNSYGSWIDPQATMAVQRGAQQRISNLVQKLMPHARAQIAQDNSLSRVAVSLRTLEHAQFLRHIGPPDSHETVDGELCISTQEVWVEGKVRYFWDQDAIKKEFASEPLPVTQLIPVDLISNEDKRLRANLRPVAIRPFRQRLDALREAQQLYDDLHLASYDAERVVPDDRVAILDRLLFGKACGGPLHAAREAWRSFDAEMEYWEWVLEAEEVALCEDVLGIRKGDNVLVESENKIQRIEVERSSVYIGDSEVSFHVWGNRYRKDGLPGKRTASFYIRVQES